MSKRADKRPAKKSSTPIRKAIKPDSYLQALVREGLGAVLDAHLIHFDNDIRSSFADSLDIDEAFRMGREQERRWDYLVGHKPTSQVIGVEPHSAKNSEITAIIGKLEAARSQLRGHLRNGMFVSKWLWVASGKVQLLPMEKAKFRLDQSGIDFVGRQITSKHLR